MRSNVSKLISQRLGILKKPLLKESKLLKENRYAHIASKCLPSLIMIGGETLSLYSANMLATTCYQKNKMLILAWCALM